MKRPPTSSLPSLAPRLARAKRAAACLALLALALLTPAHAEDSRNGLRVTVPNGYASLTVEDLRLKIPGGEVRWLREWDGQEWKFNPQWESLSQSWKNLTGSQSADTTGGTLSAGGAGAAPSAPGGDSGCWVWVDEDWSPSVGSTLIGGIPEAGPMLPVRTTPFNRLMGESGADYPPPQRVSVDYASLCAGSGISGGSTLRDAEGIRRANELYLGEGGRYAFNNRAILEKRPIQSLPPASAAQLAAGSIALAPIANPKGYRWIDKGGDWIDYNTQGQVVAWGDKNDNIVWLVRDAGGIVHGVADAQGRVLYTLHYSGELITEIKDYPAGAGDLLPARSVKYQYDANNRLTQVTDARGNATRYAYDAGNRIVRITDQEGRAEQLAYSGDMVKQRTAPDGAVTDYEFEYDDNNKQFASKITGPETAAGRRVESHAHNRAGKLVRRIVNGRTEEEVRYDTGARMEIHTNARGYTKTLTRNEFDQIVQIQNEDGSVTRTQYEARWLNPVEKTDELGIKTQYQYDARGSLIKMIEAAGTAEERITEYQVNAQGLRTRVTRKGRTEANGTVTPDAVTQNEYDAQGQIAKITDPEGNVRQFQYNRAGNLVKATDPRGNVTHYETDAGGNLVKISDALGRTRSYQYDKAGNLTRYTDARAKASQAAYDAMNRLTQITNPVGGMFKLQYNGQGLPIQVSDEDGRSRQIEFDNFLRITKQLDGLG
ncbi:MAG: hypothetical protein Q8R64_17215, partial [Sulfurimicrobium sp.]|nr:hypothetical protein [Sulfurimicrobium sp.]